MPRTVLRYRRRMICALCLGVVMTVAVSWLAMFLPRGNAWYGPLTTEDVGVVQRTDLMKTFQLSRGSNAWHTVMSYWWMQISGLSFQMNASDLNERKVDVNTLPAHFRPGTIDDLNMMAWYHATGWPFPAMTCSVHWDKQIRNSDIIYSVQNGVQFSRDSNFNPRVLPLMPLLPGFLIDTAFFALVAFVLLALPGAIIRWNRTRTGRCVHCGYSRRGIPVDAICPECGKRPSMGDGA